MAARAFTNLLTRIAFSMIWTGEKGVGMRVQPPAAGGKREFVNRARGAAVRMVSAVRTDSPVVVWEHLSTLRPDQLMGMCVVLAAMVPENRSPGELLAWVEGP